MGHSVLLIGGSGALGAPLLQELQKQKSSFQRIAVLTSSDRAQKFDDAKLDGVEVITTSFYDAATYRGFTHVISAVGNPLMILQPAIIEAAIAAGVQHFYASEWNSDISQREIYDMRYFRDKQAVRAFLRDKAASTPGFQYTLMITGIFTEWAADAFYGFDHEKATARIYGQSGARRVGVTSIRDIAKYTIDSLQMKFEGSERTIRVQGWTGTLDQLITAVEIATGRKYSVTCLDPEQAATKQEESRQAGDDEQEMMFSIKRLLASGYGVADGTGKLDNHLFDVQPEHPEITFRRLLGKTR